MTGEGLGLCGREKRPMWRRGPRAHYRVAGEGTEGPGEWLPHVCAENEIAKIPADTFLGLPNLEWLDLSKNKLDARGLHPQAFKVRGSPSSCSPRGPAAGLRWPGEPLLLFPPGLERTPCRHPARRVSMIGGDVVYS